MEHDPRKPKQDQQNEDDFESSIPADPLGDGTHELPVGQGSSIEQPAANPPADIEPAFDPERFLPATQETGEEPFDSALPSEFVAAEGRPLDSIPHDLPDSSSGGWTSRAFGDAPAPESFGFGSDFLPSLPPGESPVDNGEPVIQDLLLRNDDLPAHIETGPAVPGAYTGKVVLLGGSSDAQDSSSDLDSRTTGLLLPTSDGGPPLARPIVLVSLEEGHLQKAREETLDAAAKRDVQTIKEAADEAVDYYDWRRFCEMRALTGNY